MPSGCTVPLVLFQWKVVSRRGGRKRISRRGTRCYRPGNGGFGTRGVWRRERDEGRSHSLTRVIYRKQKTPEEDRRGEEREREREREMEMERGRDKDAKKSLPQWFFLHIDYSIINCLYDKKVTMLMHG